MTHSSDGSGSGSTPGSGSGGSQAGPNRESTRGKDDEGRQESEAGEEEGGRSSIPGRERLNRIAEASHTLEGGAYQGAMEAVLAIPISMLIGYWLDGVFETEPRYLLAGAVIGFTAMVLRLMRMKHLLPPPGGATTGGAASVDEREDDPRKRAPEQAPEESGQQGREEPDRERD